MEFRMKAESSLSECSDGESSNSDFDTAAKFEKNFRHFSGDKGVSAGRPFDVTSKVPASYSRHEPGLYQKFGAWGDGSSAPVGQVQVGDPDGRSKSRGMFMAQESEKMPSSSDYMSENTPFPAAAYRSGHTTQTHSEAASWNQYMRPGFYNPDSMRTTSVYTAGIYSKVDTTRDGGHAQVRPEVASQNDYRYMAGNGDGYMAGSSSSAFQSKEPYMQEQSNTASQHQHRNVSGVLQSKEQHTRLQPESASRDQFVAESSPSSGVFKSEDHSQATSRIQYMADNSPALYGSRSEERLPQAQSEAASLEQFVTETSSSGASKSEGPVQAHGEATSQSQNAADNSSAVSVSQSKQHAPAQPTMSSQNQKVARAASAASKAKEEKAHKCPHCPESFDRAFDLRIHIRSHTGETPFKCTKCSAAFAQASDLKIHESVHKTGDPNDYPDFPSSLHVEFPARPSPVKHLLQGSKAALKSKKPQVVGSKPSQRQVHSNKSAPVKQHGSKVTPLPKQSRSSKASPAKKQQQNKPSLLQKQLEGKLAPLPKQKQGSKAGSKTAPLQQSHSESPPSEGLPSYPFKCTECTSTFLSAHDLKVHSGTHEDKPFKCSECNASFVLLLTLKKHMMTHTSGGQLFQCTECPAAYTAAFKLKLHMTQHIGEKLGQYFKSSGAGSKGGSGKKRKGKAAAPTPAKRPKEVAASSDPKDDKPFKCTECPVTFSRPHDLKVHLRIHSGERPYKCSECTAAFARPSTLKKHERTHAGFKHFRCALCPAAYTTAYMLKHHMKKHETGEMYQRVPRFIYDSLFGQTVTVPAATPEGGGSDAGTSSALQTGDLPQGDAVTLNADGTPMEGVETRQEIIYKCPFCGTTFLRPYDLKVHMRTHTGERPYKCQHCPATFTRAGILKKHVQSHTGEKPYMCTLCPAAYTTTFKLKRHMEKHSGDKPFQCSECPASFAQASHLESHKSILHASGRSHYHSQFSAPMDTESSDDSDEPASSEEAVLEKSAGLMSEQKKSFEYSKGGDLKEGKPYPHSEGQVPKEEQPFECPSEYPTAFSQA